MDMEMAADGSVWVLEYGSDWYFNKNGSLLQLLPESSKHLPDFKIEPVAGNKRSFTVKSASNPGNVKITVTWWLTTGATERELGNGSNITVPGDEGSELRAVASDGKNPVYVARLSLLNEKATPELRLTLAGNPRAVSFNQPLSFEVKSATLPDAAQVTITARYIPPTGHDAGSLQFSPEIAALVTANQCLACHQVDNSSIGPSYLNVSLKYRNRSDAFDYLKAKLKSGGGGVWGTVPMPPQIALKDSDADIILRSILGLSEGISQSKGLLKGTLTLAPRPANAGDGGAWEFTAEAPGFTSAKFRIPAK
jgi:cytochrome c